MIRALTAEDASENRFRVIRLFLYWGMASVYIFSDVSRLSRWLPLNGPLIYPWLPSGLLTYETMFVLKWFFVLACVGGGIGWKYKLTSVLAAVAGFLFLLLCYAAGMANHQNQLPALVLVLFALQAVMPSYLSSGQLRFLIRFSFCLVFLAAGASKLSELGLGWFDEGLHLSYLLINRFAYRPSFSTENFDMNLFFIQNYQMVRPFFYTAMPFELAAPLALWKPFRFLIVVYLVMQVFAALVLYAVFLPYIPLYAIWLSERNADLMSESFARFRSQLRRVLNKQT